MNDKPDQKTEELNLAELRIQRLLFELATAETEVEALRRENAQLRQRLLDAKP